MAGDYTRIRYNPLRDTTGVLSQQGRPLLDQDTNEYVLLQNRRWRSETMDSMGRAVVPIDTPHGFEILIGGTSLTIGIGRMYVDGLQPENHGVDPTDPKNRTYDPILGEFVGAAPTPYEKQPYLTNPPALPMDNKPHLVYLDVWERELTYLEDPDLIDPALAVDTGTRLQTVWQVKVLMDQGNFDCSTPPSSVPSLAPSAGRLTTHPAGVPASTDPCIVPANGGYRGSGNRCYRVEIHNGGPMGTAQFKWSRDNASLGTAVTGINAALDKLTVVLTRRDSVLRFQPDDWVEVTDDVRYFAKSPGEMRQVAVVDDVNLTIQVKPPLPGGEFDATDPKRHTRVIRWDQRGIVRDPLGNVIVNVDANGGLIPVPAAGTTIVLEDGIQITFSIDSAMLVPNFLPLDFWMFDARVVDASIEVLTQAAPRGILHHYAWLATVTLPLGPVSNCRVFWPPSLGASCDCTVCVTAESHNNGTLTLQSAVNQVTAGGGKICLGPGIYLITNPVTINGASNIEISGHGLPTLAASGLSSSTPILEIDRCLDINLEDIAFAGPAQAPAAGVVVSNTLFIRIKRCLFTGLSSSAGNVSVGSGISTAVGFVGLVGNAQVEDCFFNGVQIGIGPSTAEENALFVAYSFIRNNEMVCTDAAFKFGSLRAFLFEVCFADNLVSAPLGFQFGGQGLDLAIERNSFNLTAGTRTLEAAGASAAIVCAGSQIRIADNQIFGDPRSPGLEGIVLAGQLMYGTQVTGNRISNLAGIGILVMSRNLLIETIIAQNQLLKLGGAGIQIESGSVALDLAITENSMAFVGLAAAASGVLGGMLVQSTLVFNVNIAENSLEAIAPDPSLNAPRAGILLMAAADVRIAGNRVLDIGPQGAVNVSAGIFPALLLGRLDVIDNEVRRASIPQLNGDPSQWSALLIGIVVGNASIRGNLLESFGSIPTAILDVASSCIFTDNQVFLDNPASPGSSTLAVRLGAQLKDKSFGGAIIASNNFVQTPVLSQTSETSQVVMSLNPTDRTKTLTVLGNITTGDIQVNGSALTAPWLPLNAKNV